MVSVSRHLRAQDPARKEALLGLTEIGNGFQIRHSEIGKAPVSDDAQVDYLFHRLFAFMFLILATATT
jgi:hypothetical protein